MAGANQLPKYALVNREGQQILHTIGPVYAERTPVTITASPLTAAQLGNDLLFTAATPNALAGPTAVELCTYFQSQIQNNTFSIVPTRINDRFTFLIQNTDPVNTKTVTLGAGFTPNTLVVPPSTTARISYELTGLNPQTWTLFEATILNTGVPPVPTGVASWQQSTAAAALPALAGEINVPRTGLVVAGPGDYAASEIKFAATATLTPAPSTVQLAIEELDNEKVTLRDITGARVAAPAGASAARDILVSTAAGDQYVPSGITWPGRIAALEIGPAAVATPVNNFAVDAIANGATPVNGVINAEFDGANLTNGWACIRSDVEGFAAMGAADRQTAYRGIMPAGVINSGVGSAVVGAYAIEIDKAGLLMFWVNDIGEVGLQPTALAGATGPLNLDANSMVTDQAIPSWRAVKHYIQDLPNSGDWIYKMRPVQFEYNDGPEHYPRWGFLMDDMVELGVPNEVFTWNRHPKNRKEIDRSKAGGICWEALTTVLVKKLQDQLQEQAHLLNRIVTLENVVTDLTKRVKAIETELTSP